MPHLQNYMWIMMTFSFKIESNKDLKMEGLKAVNI
jgi:hypothetical protein